MPEWLNLFDARFIPHALCIRDGGVITQQITGDLLIAIAYFAIPLVLFRFIIDSKFVANALLGWFAAFILLCGTTHLMGIVVLYWPLYVLDGWIKLATGVVSLITLTKLIVRMPFRSRLEMQNILLVREAGRVERNIRLRNIEKAVQLRKLIANLNAYADSVDLEIGAED